MKLIRNELINRLPTGDINYLEDPLSYIEKPNLRNYSIDDLRGRMIQIKSQKYVSFWEGITEELEKIYNELEIAGFDVGFRMINEIMHFMYVSWRYEGSPSTWNNWERYFDAQIKQKIIPKLHGPKRILQEVIESLFEICCEENLKADPKTFDDFSCFKYPESAFKLKEIDKILHEQGLYLS